MKHMIIHVCIHFMYRENDYRHKLYEDITDVEIELGRKYALHVEDWVHSLRANS
jgi:hypothetical protein